ncbi:MAG: acyl-CoA/acyl-ACP dehydrogenase [Actinomycetota bacterium]|nr:acyl-CoA/acyl-ACP dehydrogenase [Actinomycetota bacterium]
MTAMPPVSESLRAEPRARQLVRTHDQESLHTAVRDLLTDHAPWASVLERTESDAPYDMGLWGRLGNLGATGLLIPEALGGSGGDVRDLAVVCEQLGAFVAPVPFIGSAVLATAALVAVQSEPVAAELLGNLASGELTAALAVPATAVPGAQLSTTVLANDGKLNGTVTPVLDLVNAELIVVLALDQGEPALYAVQADEYSAPAVQPITALDLTRQLASLQLGETPARLIVRGEAALAAVATALVTGAAMLAAEQVGVAQWSLDTTVAYLKDRHQFGRPIGSFQALKHRMAQVWRRVGLARAAALAAADALAGASDPDEIATMVAVAASYCSETAVFAAEEMIQLHGGIGMTWEHPAHLYLGRAKADELILGAPDQHRSRLAELVDLPAS